MTVSSVRLSLPTFRLPADMPLELRFAAAQREQHRKLSAGSRVPVSQPAAGDEITETIHRQVILCMFFWPSGAASRRASICPAPKMAFWTASPLSNRVPGEVVDCPSSGSATPRVTSTSLAIMYEIEHLGHPHVRHRLVEDFLRLDGVTPALSAPASIVRNSACPCAAIHDARNAHHPRRSIEVAVTGDFAECKVIKNFD